MNTKNIETTERGRRHSFNVARLALSMAMILCANMVMCGAHAHGNVTDQGTSVPFASSSKKVFLEGNIGCRNSVSDSPVCGADSVNFTTLLLLDRGSACSDWLVFPDLCDTGDCVAREALQRCGDYITTVTPKFVRNPYSSDQYETRPMTSIGHTFVNKTATLIAESYNSSHIWVGGRWYPRDGLKYTGVTATMWYANIWCNASKPEIELCTVPESARDWRNGSTAQDCTTACWRLVDQAEADSIRESACTVERAFDTSGSRGYASRLRVGSLYVKNALPGTSGNRASIGPLSDNPINAVGTDTDTVCYAPSGFDSACQIVHQSAVANRYAVRSFCGCGGDYV